MTNLLCQVQALDRWEERLEGIFDGRPYDILDAALTDTVSKFPVHIQPFKDMIDGMRMDLVKPRYATFDELYEYCYRVAGTVGLMTTPIMGIDPAYKVPFPLPCTILLCWCCCNSICTQFALCPWYPSASKTVQTCLSVACLQFYRCCNVCVQMLPLTGGSPPLCCVTFPLLESLSHQWDSRTLRLSRTPLWHAQPMLCHS